MTSAKWLSLGLVPVAVAVASVCFMFIFAPPTMEEMVPPTLAAFFDTFDLSQDNLVNIDEAEAFFNWCEENVQYRYDDEQQLYVVPGITVGDGRPGLEYWQKPIETYQEGMGDCEDVAILNVAFYRHYGIAAYVATVNAESDEADHAVCIVKIGGTPQEASEFLGDIVYYEVEGGYFMLVDCSYSDQLGLAGSSPGQSAELLASGKFAIQDMLTLEEAYRRSG